MFSKIVTSCIYYRSENERESLRGVDIVIFRHDLKPILNVTKLTKRVLLIPSP
jgi:hypothetical protein